MILIPDDEPELSLPAASEEFLPALSGENAPVSPARAYLLSSIPPQPADHGLVPEHRRRYARFCLHGVLQLGQPAAPSRDGRDRAAARHRPGHRHRQHLSFGTQGRGEGSLDAQADGRGELPAHPGGA
jgi:hypothetical protein